MELSLIRHALPHRVELEVGAADPELSENGRAQAGHLAGYLATEHAEHRGQRIAIVCHGGVINAYLATLLSLRSGFERGFFYPNYTSIHRVAAASTGQREIVTVNETSHLRGTGLPMGLFQRS